MSDQYPPDLNPEVERALGQVKAVERQYDGLESESRALRVASQPWQFRWWALPACLVFGVLSLVLVLVIHGNDSRFIVVVTVGAALGAGALFTITAVLRYFVFRSHLHQLETELRKLHRIRARYIELENAERMARPGGRPSGR